VASRLSWELGQGLVQPVAYFNQNTSENVCRRGAQDNHHFFAYILCNLWQSFHIENMASRSIPSWFPKRTGRSIFTEVRG